MIEDGDLIHANHHRTQLRVSWSSGLGAKRAILRHISRIHRHQLDRAAHELGYRVLGGD
jgi:hypothetical protein